MRILALSAVIVAAACTPAASAVTPAPALLHPYFTTTPSITPATPNGLVLSAETPLPSPTPSHYAIREGDTLSQIAERFRISLDALLAANPQVNPSALRVGEVLQVPASLGGIAGEGTPTPAVFPVEQIACHPTATGAVWCFVLVTNNSADPIENITAQVTLLDTSGAVVDTKTAVLPLDILPPGASLPISALFPPPVPIAARPQVQILTAMALESGDPRYLDLVPHNTTAAVSWSGRSANVTGEISLAAGSAGASSAWIVAVAYDALGNVVGWRRWESAAPIGAGSSVPFELTLSSVAGGIDRVEFVGQARP